MKLANLAGRAALVVGDRAIDLATVTDGDLGPDVQPLFARWPEVQAVAARLGARAHRPRGRPPTRGPVARADSSRLPSLLVPSPVDHGQPTEGAPTARGGVCQRAGRL